MKIKLQTITNELQNSDTVLLCKCMRERYVTLIYHVFTINDIY